MHALGLLRQKHSSLARRVSSPDYRYFLTFTPLRFDACGPVVNSVALEPREILDGGSVVLCAGCDDDGPGCQKLSRVEHYLIRAIVTVETCHTPRDQHVRAEFLGLRGRACGQFH